MVQEIARGTRRTRKPHRCFDCREIIPAGTEVAFFTGAFDGAAYTLYMHQDCQEAAWHWRDLVEETWPEAFLISDEGYPPLIEDLHDCGEFEPGCDALRGHFPHVVARLELRDQKQAIRLGDWQAYG